jgi:predicted hydrocarbon binding protein
MPKKYPLAIENLGRNLERYATEEAKEKVFEGSEKLAKISDPAKIALWVQGAMKRLDRAVDKKTGARIMEECGYACAKANHATIDRVVAKRNQYASLEEFLEAEKDKALPGMRLERKGKIIYQYYMPLSFRYAMRCFCSLLRGLPPGETVSTTYCQCSKGFAQKMWERLLGKPVKVEVLETAVTGAKECKFKIYLKPS